MCGIAGIYSFDKKSIDHTLLKRMADRMVHRGPDDEGFYISLPIGLSHRRLSILDLSEAGHQPMASTDSRLWIVYNGEIYNYLEIKESLLKKGYQFNSKADTEVILYAYQEWGTRCLERFNGMWAFALWDQEKKELFCARDRFGIKPFYYFFDGIHFAFASEIKALFACPFIKKEVNQEVVYDYLVLDLVSHNQDTFFHSIKQLEPAHYLLVNEKRITVSQYYTIPFTKEIGTFNEKKCNAYAGTLHTLLKDSVKLHLRSDVPIGSCLSGGIDSSTIVSIANTFLQSEGIPKGIIGEHQQTFSSCFEDKRFDERVFIEKLIQCTQATPHFVFPTKHRLWEELENIIWHQEEPFVSTSVYAQWCVMRLAKQHGIKVLLDGQGADELFAGYKRYIDSYLNQFLTQGSIFRFLWEVGQIVINGSHSPKNLLFHITKEWAMLLPSKIRLHLRQMANPHLRLINPKFLKKYRERETLRIKQRGKFNLQTRLWEDHQLNLRGLLRYEDKNSMAFSLEARVPFLDYRLVEFVFSLPAVYKIHHGWTKYLLREATENLLPEEIRWRKDKMGFVTPERIWLRESKEKIKKILTEHTFKSGEFFDRTLLINNFDYLLQKEDENIASIWRFINLELWLKVFF